MRAHLLVYANAFSAGFTLDNKGLIVEDPRLRGVSAENVGEILDRSYWRPKGESGLYRPVTAINPRCSLVCRQFCQAAPGALQTLAAAGSRDAGAQKRH